MDRYTERRIRIPVFIQIIIVALAFALIVTGIPYAIYTMLQKPTITMPTNATVVTEVQQVGKLEAVSYTIQKIITYNSDANSWWNFLGESQKIFIVYGKVTAGIDFSALNSSDVQIQGKELASASITFNLPAPQILNSTIDNTRTKVYDANSGLSGLWSQNLDGNTTLQILNAAQNSIQSDACQQGILQQAADSSKAQLTAFLKTIGFSAVTVTIPTATCS